MPVVDLPPPLIATSNQATTTIVATTNWPIVESVPVVWQSGVRSDLPVDAVTQWQQMNTNEPHWPSGLHYHDGNFFRTTAVVAPSNGSTQVYLEGSHQQPVQSILSTRPFDHNEKYLEELEIMQASDIIAFESPVSRSLPNSVSSEGPPMNTSSGNGNGGGTGGGCGGGGRAQGDGRVAVSDGNCDSMCLHSDSSSACDEYVVTSLDQVTGEYRSGLGHLSPDANQLAWGLRRLYQTNLPTQDRPRDLVQAAPQSDWREEYLNHQVISCPPNSAVKVEPST